MPLPTAGPPPQSEGPGSGEDLRGESLGDWIQQLRREAQASLHSEERPLPRGCRGHSANPRASRYGWKRREAVKTNREHHRDDRHQSDTISIN